MFTKKCKISKNEIKVICIKLLILVKTEIEEDIIIAIKEVGLRNGLLFIDFNLYPKQISQKTMDFDDMLKVLKQNKKEVKTSFLKCFNEIVKL